MRKLFESFDSDRITQVGSRRDALRGAGKLGAGLALASIPGALMAAVRSVSAQQEQLGLVDILQYAYTLEVLEATFYEMGLAQEGLIPQEARDLFTTLRDHERAHAEFLANAIQEEGGTVPSPEFDFTGEGAFPDVFSSYTTFVTLAQGFEDTGIRAYKGVAPMLLNNPEYLQSALKIHSVEGRHAAKIRRLAASPAEEAWIPFDNTDVAALQPVYEGMAEVVKYGINVVQVSGVGPEAVTESFDEPLSPSAVRAIVDRFIVGDIDGDGEPV